RMLTIEWQPLTPNHGFTRPELIDEAGATSLFDETMDRSARLYDALRPDFPNQAAYAVAMAYRLRYVMQFNAREAIHMLELRSAAWTPSAGPSRAVRGDAPTWCDRCHKATVKPAVARALVSAPTAGPRPSTGN